MAAVTGTASRMPTKPNSEPKAKSANISHTGCTPTLEPTSRGCRMLPSMNWPTKNTPATAAIQIQSGQNCTSATPTEMTNPTMEPTNAPVGSEYLHIGWVDGGETKKVLLRRAGRTVQLTEAALALVERTDPILDALEQAAAGGAEAAASERCRELLDQLQAHNAKEEPIIYHEGDARLTDAEEDLGMFTTKAKLKAGDHLEFGSNGGGDLVVVVEVAVLAGGELQLGDARAQRHRDEQSHDRHDAGALAREQVLVDPAFRAVRVADFAPGVEFLDDFHRRAGFHIDPGDPVLGARSDADIDRSGSGGGKTGQRQAARPFDGRRTMAARLSAAVLRRWWNRQRRARFRVEVWPGGAPASGGTVRVLGADPRRERAAGAHLRDHRGGIELFSAIWRNAEGRVVGVRHLRHQQAVDERELQKAGDFAHLYCALYLFRRQRRAHDGHADPLFLEIGEFRGAVSSHGRIDMGIGLTGQLEGFVAVGRLAHHGRGRVGGQHLLQPVADDRMVIDDGHLRAICRPGREASTSRTA